MSRGKSSGGGQSSLGYLFESEEMPNLRPGPEETSNKPQGPPSEDGKAKAPEQAAGKPTSNNYHRAHGQNAGNFITGRPTTKVHSVPGGGSSLGYLFGDK